MVYNNYCITLLRSAIRALFTRIVRRRMTRHHTDYVVMPGGRFTERGYEPLPPPSPRTSIDIFFMCLLYLRVINDVDFSI